MVGAVRATFLAPRRRFRQNRTVRVPAILLLLGLTAWAGPADEQLESWVDSQGGRIERAADGRIVAVDLANSWVHDADLRRIAALGSLERLDLSQTRITDVGLESLAPLQGVRELNLYFAEFVSELGVANLKSWSSLEKLNLRGTMVRGRVFDTLAQLENLRELDLSHTRITDDGFDALSRLARLERLSIGSNRLDGAVLESLKLIPNLRALDLRGVQRVDSGIWGLALNRRNLERLSELTSLEELWLGGATITDVGSDRPGLEDAERAELPHLDLLSSLKRLHTLDLNRQPITVEDLRFLPKLPQLLELNLGQCVRLDDSVADLLLDVPQLEAVYLAGTGLTDDGLAKLQSLGLKRLSLGGDGVSEAAVASYRKASPSTALSWFAAEDFDRIRAAQ